MCKYCESKDKVLYQADNYGNLYIGNAGKRKSLIFVPDVGSIHSYCAVRERKVEIAYPINFCPECGRKLTEKQG